MVQQVTVRDLLQVKEYGLVEFRCPYPSRLNLAHLSILIGYCTVENGKLIPMDGDYYSDKEIVLSHEEWAMEDGKLALTVVVDTEWSEKYGSE